MQNKSQVQPKENRRNTMSESTNPHAPAMMPTRRQAMAGIAVGLFACTRILAETQQQPSTTQAPSTAPGSKRTSLHQEVDLKATPQRIYQVLLSSKDFAAFTGAPAAIDPKPGGAFSLFGGAVVGRNVDLVPNQRIVQAWRVVADFPEGVYTMVKFELKPRDSQTSVILDQTGFAEGDFDHLSAGWHSRYWDTLKVFLAKP
jgi:activator of HSP90 ATPase